MKKLFWFAVLLFSVCVSAQAFNDGSFSKPEDVFPQNWKVIAKSTGDLNGDGKADIAMAVTDTNPKQFFTNPTAQDPTFKMDMNSRFVLILLNQNDKFRYDPKYKISIPPQKDSANECMREPFPKDGLQIQNGLLQLRLAYDYDCISFESVAMDFTFAFLKDDFELRRIVRNASDISNGNTGMADYDFLKRKITIQTGGNNKTGKANDRTEFKKLKMSKLVKMQDFNYNSEYDYQ